MGHLETMVKAIPGIRYLRQVRYARFFKNADNLNLFHQVFADFKSAEAAAPRNKALGYDHEEPAALYDQYIENVGPSDFASMFWLERLRDEIKSVYDFGGHVGIKYYAYSKYLSSKGNIAWTVYDLPAVISRGKRLAKERKAHSLHFSESVSDLEKGVDLLFASGSLQYLDNPVDALFKNLRNKPKYVLINMIPLHDDKSYVTLQNIGPAFCPYKIFHKAKLVGQLSAYGYELQYEWKNPEKTCIIPFNEEHNVIGYSGLLLKLA